MLLHIIVSVLVQEMIVERIHAFLTSQCYSLSCDGGMSSEDGLKGHLQLG